MHFISEYNPNIQCDDKYYRIKESFRDLTGRVRCRIMLNVGFMAPRLRPEEVRDVAACLAYMSEHKGEQDMFGGVLAKYNETVKSKAKEYWNRMIELGKIDSIKKCIEESRYKAERLVDVNTIKHTDARDVDAEWIWQPGLRDVYKVASSLYELKDELEDHLCRRTDSLFNVSNRLVLFDLTNFYFEGRKDGSAKAKFGRSKEKRSDCKLLVLALCINAEGFIRYSSILAGNTADPDSLPNMIDTLSSKTRVPSGNSSQKTLVVIDAGIATEDNWEKIKSKGYNYLCVSRRRLTDYELADDMKTVTVLDSKKQTSACVR